MEARFTIWWPQANLSPTKYQHHHPTSCALVLVFSVASLLATFSRHACWRNMISQLFRMPFQSGHPVIASMLMDSLAKPSNYGSPQGSFVFSSSSRLLRVPRTLRRRSYSARAIIERLLLIATTLCLVKHRASLFRISHDSGFHH